METITLTKDEFDSILKLIADYNENDETAFGGKWEEENWYFLDIARRGVSILKKYGIEPANDFETQQP